MLNRPPILAMLAALVVVGCAATHPTVPQAVSTMLDGWRQAGVSCGDPVVGYPDKIPQWRCTGILHEVPLAVEFEGSVAGLVELMAQVPAATDRAAATGAFVLLISATSALATTSPAIDPWLRAWGGPEAAASFGTATVRVQSDATWITLTIVLSKSP